MSFQQTLAEAGFSLEASSRLLDSKCFTARNKNKSAIEIAKQLIRIAEIYTTNSNTIRKAVLTFPQFVSLDHARVLNGIKGVYNCTDERAVKAVLTFPPFAGYDHARVINGIKGVYNCTDEQAAAAVLAHPQLAGYDHTRVLKQHTKIGGFVGVEWNRARDEILKRPRLAGFSVKRYLAVIDVFRQLDSDLAGVPKEHLVDWWLRNFAKSPYVPGMKRERVSHAIKKGSAAEPDLMNALRRSAPKLRVKA